MKIQPYFSENRYFEISITQVEPIDTFNCFAAWSNIVQLIVIRYLKATKRCVKFSKFWTSES